MIKPYKFALALIASVGLTLTSCNDDPEISPDAQSYVAKGDVKEGYINPTFFDEYISGNSDVAFKVVNRSLYNSDELTNGEWELEDRVADGRRAYTPSSITISEGKIWREVYSETYFMNYSYYNEAMSFFNKALGTNYKPLVGYPTSYDSESHTLYTSLGTFEVIAANKNALTISKVIPYAGGRTHNGGLSLEIACYTKEAAEPLSENTVKFDNDVAAYEWLLEQYLVEFQLGDLPTEEYDLCYLWYYNDWTDPYYIAGWLAWTLKTRFEAN